MSKQKMERCALCGKAPFVGSLTGLPQNQSVGCHTHGCAMGHVCRLTRSGWNALNRAIRIPSCRKARRPGRVLGEVWVCAGREALCNFVACDEATRKRFGCRHVEVGEVQKRRAGR
ncbi:MAG: hypothetical protein WC789_09530 [Lentisphaeria bacterium]